MDENITDGPVNTTPTGCWSEQLYIFQPWVQAIFISLYVVTFVVGDKTTESGGVCKDFKNEQDANIHGGYLWCLLVPLSHNQLG